MVTEEVVGEDMLQRVAELPAHPPAAAGKPFDAASVFRWRRTCSTGSLESELLST